MVDPVPPPVASPPPPAPAHYADIYTARNVVRSTLPALLDPDERAELAARIVQMLHDLGWRPATSIAAPPPTVAEMPSTGWQPTWPPQ